MLLPLIGNRLQQKHLSLAFKHLIKQGSACACNLSEMATGEQRGLLLTTVVAKLNNFAPLSLAESWDNVGLLVEPKTKKDVKKILLTNDLTEDVMEEALEVNADLIISYHPPIFSPLKCVTNRSWKERVIATCLENRIAVYSPHTSFDAVSGGVNDWLASAFETKSLQPLTQGYAPDMKSKPFKVEITSTVNDPVRATMVLQQIKNRAETISSETIKGEISEAEGALKLTMPCSKSSLPLLAEIFQAHIAEDNKEFFRITKYEDIPLPGIGMGRLCTLAKPVNVMTIVDLVKKHVHLSHVRLALARQRNMDSIVSTIALCAGSGASVLRGVKADLYLTGEMSHHDVLNAVHRGSHVILCDHSNTERGFLRVFAKKLSDEILDGKIEVFVSKTDRDPLHIV